MGLTDMGMSANTGSGTVLVVGDVLHEVDHESGLFVDFLWMLYAGYRHSRGRCIWSGHRDAMVPMLSSREPF